MRHKRPVLVSYCSGLARVVPVALCFSLLCFIRFFVSLLLDLLPSSSSSIVQYANFCWQYSSKSLQISVGNTAEKRFCSRFVNLFCVHHHPPFILSQLSTTDVEELILVQVFTPPGLVETKDALVLFTGYEWISLRFLHRQWKGYFAALQSHPRPLVTLAKHAHFAPTPLEIADNRKAQRRQLASDLVRAAASHGLHLELHDIMDVRRDLGAPQLARQAGIGRVLVFGRDASGAEVFVTHLSDAQLTLVPVFLAVKAAAAAAAAESAARIGLLRLRAAAAAVGVGCG